MAINSVLGLLPLILFSLTLLTTVVPKPEISYFLDSQETPINTTTTTVPPLPPNITPIIFAVISTGNFQNWAALLSENPSLLLRNFTFFLPSNNHQNYSSSFTKPSQKAQQLHSYSLFLYHIVPIRLSFSDLCRFSPATRLPTLVITTNSKNNTDSVSCSVCIHGSCITRRNIYQDEFSFVHGVGPAFDYTEEITGKIWVFLSVLGAYWIIFLNPFQLFPVIIDNDNNEAILEELQRVEEILELLELERMEEEDEDERRRERDERESTEDEENEEELRRQYEIDEVRYFQEFDD